MPTAIETSRTLATAPQVGNRWYKVNLHVHARGIDPAELVAQARVGEIDLVAITDHQTFDYYDAIAAEAAKPGRELTVLPGIEITAHEGVQLLAVFPAAYSAHQRTLFMGWLEVNPPGDPKVASKKKVSEIFEKVDAEGGIIVIPHPFTQGMGLLDSARKISTKLDWLESGHVRLIQTSEDKVKYIGHDEQTGVWINRYVLASATLEQVGKSKYSLAPLNRSDAQSVAETEEGCSWFRMEAPTVESMKQVTCEPHTRVLRHAPSYSLHDCILQVSIKGNNILD